MKIGMDAKRAVANMTGLGNYSRLVAEELANAYPEDTLYLYTPTLTASQKSNPRLERINQMPNVEFRLPYGLGPLSRGALWRSIGITRHFQADKLDIFHGLSNELPLNASSTGIPTVVTIHDVIYRRMPECYPPLDRKIYDWKYGKSARMADRIIAISECTKRDIVDIYGVNPDKIDVIYQGCDPQFRRHLTGEEIESIKKKYNLSSRYIIQVGRIEKRKNLELTLKALAGLPEEVKLVAVGRDNAYLHHIRKIAAEAGVAERLIHLEGVPFSDLPGLYQGAEIIAYPSLYEGFGIPVLEGLESRRPVIAATGSCLEEAGGDGAWYVSPDNVKEMSDTMNAILRRESDIEAKIGKGITHARKFDTSTMASAIMDSYSQAIETHNSQKLNKG